MNKSVKPLSVEDGTEKETIHKCPPLGSGIMPCCGKTPFEVPRTDRMTLDRTQVTCHPGDTQ